MTATAPFMSAAPSPWTAPPSRRPGRLSCAGTVSRWPARRTSGRAPPRAAPARRAAAAAARAPGAARPRGAGGHGGVAGGARPGVTEHSGPERGEVGLVPRLGWHVDELEGAG